MNVLNGLNGLNSFNSVPLHPHAQHFAGGANLPSRAERATDPRLASIEFRDARAQVNCFYERRRLEIGNVHIRRDVADARRAADGARLKTISVGDGEIQTVAIDQRSDDAAVKIFSGAAAVVRLGAPSRDRLVAIPVTF